MKGSKDYANAKVYKLISIVDDYFYIGSTCGTLVNRYQDHRSRSKSKPHIKVYEHFISIGWDNVKIILIDDSFTCVNQDQLRREEQRHIDLHKHTGLLLNACKSWTGMTKVEWQIDWNNRNPERLKEIKKKYRDTHKDEIKGFYEKTKYSTKQWKKEYYERVQKARKSELIECPICGSHVSRGWISGHRKTAKCLEKANTI